MGNIPFNLSCICPPKEDKEDDIEKIKNTLKKMQDNHLTHIETDVKKNTENIQEIKLDIREIKGL